MANEPIYRITFFNQGQVYEIYARHVFQMQSIIRIDEVEKEGASKITEASGNNVSPFPFPSMANSKPSGDSL